jgi:4-carboxymuconolactone decarboxylase
MALVPLRTSADATGKAAETLASIEEHGNVMPVLRAVSNAQTAFSAFVRYSAALVYRLELPARVRELVIMRAAAHWRSRYEWGEHYTFASGAGVTEDELRVLAAGEIPSTLTEIEGEVLRLTDHVLNGKAVKSPGDPHPFAALEERLGAQLFTELALVLGWWCGCVPTLIEVLGLEEDAPEVAVPL